MEEKQQQKAIFLITFLSIFGNEIFSISKDKLSDLLTPRIMYLLIILMLLISAILHRGSDSKTSRYFVFLVLFFL
jgi:hypothetical protein